MKTHFTFLILLGAGLLHAQNFEWANPVGGHFSTINGTGSFGPVLEQYIQSVTVDDYGNVYVTGLFYGTSDFDPGAATFNLTSVGSSDIFITKYNASGALLWAKRMGGTGQDAGNAIAVDALGNVLTTGYFKNDADFDPSGDYYFLSTGPGVYSGGTYYPPGTAIFISKLDASGNFVWAKQINGTGDDHGSAITVDDSDNVITTGKFSGGTPAIDYTDFDPGVGTFYLSVGGGFISKLNSAGEFIWAKQFGQEDGAPTIICSAGVCSYNKNYSLAIQSVAVDGYSNVFATGHLVATTDFDPDADVYNLTPIGFTDAFVIKLHASGSLEWAKQMGGKNALSAGVDIAIDGAGSVFTTGLFSGKIDFDPGAASHFLVSPRPSSIFNYEVFVSKWENSGNFVWAKRMGGDSWDVPFALTLDGQGNVYTTGFFSGAADFDPGNGADKYILTTDGDEEDIFISKLDNGGRFVWARRIGDTEFDVGDDIAVDHNKNVLVTGFVFSDIVDFDPNDGLYDLSSPSGDFVLKLSQPESMELGAPGIDIAFDIDFDIYPNPAKERVRIIFSHTTESNFEILLSDMEGKMIKRFHGLAQQGNNTKEFYLGNIPQGMYQILFVTDEMHQAKILVVE